MILLILRFDYTPDKESNTLPYIRLKNEIKLWHAVKYRI